MFTELVIPRPPKKSHVVIPLMLFDLLHRRLINPKKENYVKSCSFNYYAVSRYLKKNLNKNTNQPF